MRLRMNLIAAGFPGYSSPHALKFHILYFMCVCCAEFFAKFFLPSFLSSFIPSFHFSSFLSLCLPKCLLAYYLASFVPLAWLSALMFLEVSRELPYLRKELQDEIG